MNRFQKWNRFILLPMIENPQIEWSQNLLITVHNKKQKNRFSLNSIWICFIHALSSIFIRHRLRLHYLVSHQCYQRWKKEHLLNNLILSENVSPSLPLAVFSSHKTALFLRSDVTLRFFILNRPKKFPDFIGGMCKEYKWKIKNRWTKNARSNVSRERC